MLNWRMVRRGVSYVIPVNVDAALRHLPDKRYPPYRTAARHASRVQQTFRMVRIHFTLVPEVRVDDQTGIVLGCNLRAVAFSCSANIGGTAAL